MTPATSDDLADLKRIDGMSGLTRWRDPDDPVLTIIDAVDWEHLELYPTSGDCGSVAVALDSVFGADGFACAFGRLNDDPALHVCPVIRGQVYDSKGITTVESLREFATTSVFEDAGQGMVWEEAVELSSAGVIERELFYDNPRAFCGPSLDFDDVARIRAELARIVRR